MNLLNLKVAGEVFVIGTILTLALVAYLAWMGKWAWAALVILVSPFPCPTGLPC